jgi:tRNA threonylcarbamoyladenosine biosynthesis protein TsaE
MQIEIRNVEGLSDAAQKFLSLTGADKIFLFTGEMGVGKTTFIKAVCQKIGVSDIVSSPTYSIVNEYQYDKGKIYHFDFYRIKTETEAYDIGFEEYLYSGNYCFIEWPEKIKGLWPSDYVEVAIEQNGDMQRNIKLRKVHPNNEP